MSLIFDDKTTLCPAEVQEGGALCASGGRRIDYLRISITDRCTLNCAYCDRGATRGDERLLSAEEIARVVSAALGIGIRRVRLTGGEPLDRPDVLEVVRRVASLPVDDLAMTTNGLKLASLAEPLRRAGLRRVNVSLSTLDANLYRSLTGSGRLEAVLDGIRCARRAGLEPVKLNAVMLRGVNDHQVVPLAIFGQRERVVVRFIEYMPSQGRDALWMISADEILKALAPLEPHVTQSPPGSGPARYYALRGGGLVGFITPVSEPFCGVCNRLRVTAFGRLRPCLIDEHEIDLVPLLESPLADELVREAFHAAATLKPVRYQGCRRRAMRQIGG